MSYWHNLVPSSSIFSTFWCKRSVSFGTRLLLLHAHGRVNITIYIPTPNHVHVRHAHDQNLVGSSCSHSHLVFTHYWFACERRSLGTRLNEWHHYAPRPRHKSENRCRSLPVCLHSNTKYCCVWAWSNVCLANIHDFDQSGSASVTPSLENVSAIIQMTSVFFGVITDCLRVLFHQTFWRTNATAH